MLLKKLPLIAIGSVSVALLVTSRAFAAQITVSDCNGTPRLIKQVADNENQSIRLVTTSAAPAGTEFQLSLVDTTGNEKNSTLIGGGTVTFHEVAPGTWRICGLPDTVTLDEVTILGSAQTTTLQVASVAGAGALLGGGLLLGSQDSSSSDDELPVTLDAVVEPSESDLEMLSGVPSTNLEMPQENEVAKNNDRRRPFSQDEDCTISGAETCLIGTDITGPISPFR